MLTVPFILGMLLVGVGVGLMNAALGIGGGILMVPALLEFVPGMDPHTAKGTSLFVIVFVAAINAWRQNRGHTVPWRAALFLVAGSMLGGYAGAWVTGLLSGVAITWVFVGVLGVIVVRLLLSEPKPAPVRQNVSHDIVALSIGLVTGVASGATGIGGGLVLVPLVLVAGIASNERVTALSNLVMVATCASAVAVQLRAASTLSLPGTVGQVSLALAPLIFVGAQLGSLLGRRINTRLTYGQRKGALIATIVIVMVRMALRAFR